MVVLLNQPPSAACLPAPPHPSPPPSLHASRPPLPSAAAALRCVACAARSSKGKSSSPFPFSPTNRLPRRLALSSLSFHQHLPGVVVVVGGWQTRIVKSPRSLTTDCRRRRRRRRFCYILQHRNTPTPACLGRYRRRILNLFPSVIPSCPLLALLSRFGSTLAHNIAFPSRSIERRNRLRLLTTITNFYSYIPYLI